MNTLKPLLTVAVLAGIGYGVYIRLNAGANAPPPPVDAGWNNSPSIQLPEASGSAPWSAPAGAVASATPGAPPATVTVPGGEAPAFGAAASAGAPPAASAPSFGQAPPAVETVAPAPVPGAPAPEAAPHAAAVETPPPPGGAPPYEHNSSAPGAVIPPDAGVPSDPYGAPAGGSADPYGAPAPDYGAPPVGAPDDYSVPPAGGAPADGAAPQDGVFASTMQSVRRELENGQLASALRQLTNWYGSPQLNPAEQQELNSLLDQVAGTVVYSTQNLLEHPYEVQPGERLEAIGEKYQVPWQLLAKINGITDPASLQPGERLKVVRGPFKATILLDRREMVLYTGEGLYAGRFKVGIGAEHPPQEGTFVVSDKTENPVYYGSNSALGAEDPNNPLGERWIGLGKQMAIHGTNKPENIGRTDLPGWISLSETDVVEVYDILGLGSQVTVRR